VNVRNYALVTGAYWAFTITDGALRMLVLLHFHELGYSPVALALLFLLYELMGVVTNLVGGWVAPRWGLNRTLATGLAVQIIALSVLSLQDPAWAEVGSVIFVMGAQALSGIAKDLTKMSSKSAIKFVVGGATETEQQSALFKWVAILTGSKNALKGVGFFIGGALLSWLGFSEALLAMAGVLVVVLIGVLALLDRDIGRAVEPEPFGSILSKSTAVNRLSAARFFLFGARDVWFVVALPIYLDEALGWSFEAIGGFLAAWVIGYGIVQAAAPRVLGRQGAHDVRSARWLAMILGLITLAIAGLLSLDIAEDFAVIGGLVLFGVVFALNSSMHSYLILAYSTTEKVVTDVGFYYSANAAGRLAGTLASGLVYLAGGLTAAMWTSAGSIGVTWLWSRLLPPITESSAAT
jgi:predicted MFS family arabinose efflux permease